LSENSLKPTRKLFGTDGVRGPVDELLTPELVYKLARVVTVQLSKGVPQPKVLLVRDTRESGQQLARAVSSGVIDGGGTALSAGVLPTPAAPLLVKRYGFDLAVVISASHNPYYDNGIKFFAADGFKLSDSEESEIEQALESQELSGSENLDRQPEELMAADQDYLRELNLRFKDLDLSNYSVALDCANGAAYKVAPEIFTRLGAQVTVVSSSPDGRNINQECGSTYPEKITEVVTSGDYDIGFAFDGDGDRVITVDRNGSTVDGDELLATAAKYRKDNGILNEQGVVVTVMSNYGFHQAMEQMGISVVTTNVGDRYVLEELRSRNWQLGGEQSGHTVQLDYAPSGDGIAAALLLLEALNGRQLTQGEIMTKLPQKLVNVTVSDRDEACSASDVADAVEHENTLLEGRGRILVRSSGTEPIVRVMVEAPSMQEAEASCERVVQVLKRYG